MKIISVEKMKQLESTANAGGYGYDKMMKKAGQNLAQVVHERYFSTEVNHASGLVGSGNNGGDTLIALLQLQKLGWTCSALIMKPDQQWQPLINDLQASGGRIADSASFEKEISGADLILDGVFGTGFKPPMRAPYPEIFIKIAELSHKKIVVAVDCPSGVDCVSGETCAETLKANLTVSMEAVKEGMLKFPGFEFCGELTTVDLGIPSKYLKEFENGNAILDEQKVRNYLPKRNAESHKGIFGHLIVCGGCVNYPGAPMLAAKSAYRVGAGLVECALPERIYEPAAANNLECIFTLLEDEDGVIAENAAATLSARINTAQCLLLGPGIGREETTQRFIQRILFESEGRNLSSGVGFVPGKPAKRAVKIEKIPPLVIDADALRLLPKTPDWFKKLPSMAVLTPHPGEMAALTGLTIDEIQKDRISIVRKYAELWQHVVVLKGALTLAASPDGLVTVIPFANSILAKAGTGDVLAGMIAGFIAQGMESYKAAQTGAWVHAQTAAAVAKTQRTEASLIAGDLVAAIPEIMAALG